MGGYQARAQAYLAHAAKADVPADASRDRVWRAVAQLAANPKGTSTVDLTVDDLEAMFGKTERWVTLKTHVPVHIAYFTVRADADGTLHSYGDIYGQNARLIGLLNGTAKPAAPTKTPIISGV